MPNLGVAVDAYTTVFVFGSPVTIPGGYPARYTVGSEVVHVTGGSGTRYLSVDRGVDDTVAAAHAVNAAFTSAPAGAGGSGGVTVDNTVDPPFAASTLIAPGATESAPDEATMFPPVVNGVREIGEATAVFPTESTGDPAFDIRSADDPSDFAGTFRIQSSASQAMFEVDSAGEVAIHPKDVDATGLLITLPALHVGGAIGVSVTGVAGVALIDSAGRYRTKAATAPADGDLAAGELALWFDPTNGAGKLKIKAKTLNGTIVTGSVDLA